MNDLLAAAKAVIEEWDYYGNVYWEKIKNLRAAVERAEKQKLNVSGADCGNSFFDELKKREADSALWTAAQHAERDRIRARAKIAAEKTWKAGDWYIGPQHANFAKFIDALLEHDDE